jgi:hypothetical protein
MISVRGTEVIIETGTTIGLVQVAGIVIGVVTTGEVTIFDDGIVTTAPLGTEVGRTVHGTIITLG